MAKTSVSGFAEIQDAIRTSALGRMLVTYEADRPDLACVDEVSNAVWCALADVYDNRWRDNEQAEGALQTVLACFAGHTIIEHRDENTRAMHLGIVDLTDTIMSQVVGPCLAPAGAVLCACNRAWLPGRCATPRNEHRMCEGHVFDGCCD